MRDCPEYVEPVNTTARVTIVMDTEPQLYDVSVEGYPDREELHFWGVHPCNSDGRRRECVVDDMHRVLVRFFYDVWTNTGNEYFGERSDLIKQLKAAIEEAAYEANG